MGRALRAAQVAWVCLTATAAGLGTAGSVRAIVHPELVAMRPTEGLLDGLGIDDRFIGIVALTAPLVFVVAIGIVVFSRRRHSPMALLFTATLILFYLIGSRSLLGLRDVPGLQHAGAVTLGLMYVGLALVLALFPDGRFVPRWSRWLAPAMATVVVAFPDAFDLGERMLQGDPTAMQRGRSILTTSFVLLVLGFVAQAYRYRYVSGSIARQQAKWVVVPFAALLVVTMAAFVLSAARPETTGGALGWALIATLPLLIVVPIGVANAVLHHRLYEIDRIISRTLSYGLVVAILGAVYAVGAVGLGSVAARLTGDETSDLVVAASVLTVAALFGRVRTRVQRAVDRRFNRSGVEATSVVERFVHGLRDEVELETITRGVVATAARAVQPTGVSVWLVTLDDQDASAETLT